MTLAEKEAVLSDAADKVFDSKAGWAVVAVLVNLKTGESLVQARAPAGSVSAILRAFADADIGPGQTIARGT